MCSRLGAWLEVGAQNFVIKASISRSSQGLSEEVSIFHKPSKLRAEGHTRWNAWRLDFASTGY